MTLSTVDFVFVPTWVWPRVQILKTHNDTRMMYVISDHKNVGFQVRELQTFNDAIYVIPYVINYIFICSFHRKCEFSRLVMTLMTSFPSLSLTLRVVGVMFLLA